MKSKDKRGFLLGEETLKIIIAVICILFLIYFLTSLYFANKKTGKLEQAQDSLEFIIENIRAENTEIDIFNPTGWYIFAWPVLSEDNEILKPDLCSNAGWDNCVCICGLPPFQGNKPINIGNVKSCDSDKVCLEVNKKTIIQEETNKIKIEPPLQLNIEYGDEVIIRKNDA